MSTDARDILVRGIHEDMWPELNYKLMYGELSVNRLEYKFELQMTACECGSMAVGSNFHSTWCPKYERN